MQKTENLYKPRLISCKKQNECGEEQRRVKKCRHTRNIVPLGTVGDALLKIFIRVKFLTRVSIVHQRILLHTHHTQVRTQQ